MGSDVDHCFQHDQQGEMIHITCEFNRNTFDEGNCPIVRADPYFDITVNDSELSVICSLNSSGKDQLRPQNGAGVCWCNQTFSSSSSCTLLLNTTSLGRRQVTWKGCSQITIELEAENINTTHRKYGLMFVFNVFD